MRCGSGRVEDWESKRKLTLARRKTDVIDWLYTTPLQPARQVNAVVRILKQASILFGSKCTDEEEENKKTRFMKQLPRSA
jgi:hypothetical protein